MFGSTNGSKASKSPTRKTDHGSRAGTPPNADFSKEAEAKRIGIWRLRGVLDHSKGVLLTLVLRDCALKPAGLMEVGQVSSSLNDHSYLTRWPSTYVFSITRPSRSLVHPPQPHSYRTYTPESARLLPALMARLEQQPHPQEPRLLRYRQTAPPAAEFDQARLLQRRCRGRRRGRAHQRYWHAQVVT